MTNPVSNLFACGAENADTWAWRVVMIARMIGLCDILRNVLNVKEFFLCLYPIESLNSLGSITVLLTPVASLFWMSFQWPWAFRITSGFKEVRPFSKSAPSLAVRRLRCADIWASWAGIPCSSLSLSPINPSSMLSRVASSLEMFSTISSVTTSTPSVVAVT